MKQFLKNFTIRGLMFSWGGPLVYAIVMLILHLSDNNTLTNGLDIFMGIFLTLILAFIHAGSSAIWQEEKFGLGTKALIHGTILYFTYFIVYFLNNWIPRNLNGFLIFSAIFISTYLIIWLIIWLIERNKVAKLNSKLIK